MIEAQSRAQRGAGDVPPLESSSGARRPRPQLLNGVQVARIRRLLLIKSALEFVLVVGLVAVFIYSDIYSNVTGEVEVVEGGSVRGWIAAGDASGDVELQLFINGRFHTSTVARNAEQANEVGNGVKKNGRRAFVIPLGQLPAGSHEARVYASFNGDGVAASEVRQVLILIGKPALFDSAGTGR